MWLLLKYTLLYASVLAMVALGGMFSERSGVINIALEGIMIIGGLMGVIMINLLNAWGVPVFLGIILTILIPINQKNNEAKSVLSPLASKVAIPAYDLVKA